MSFARGNYLGGMDQQQLLQSLAHLDLMEMLDLYLWAKTGHRCFAEEVLPVNLLSSLYEVEMHIHQYNAIKILKTVLKSGEDEEC